MTGIDWPQCPICESEPGKLGGAWTLRSLRISADQIVDNQEDRACTEEIAEWFGLDVDDVNTLSASPHSGARMRLPSDLVF